MFFLFLFLFWASSFSLELQRETQQILVDGILTEVTVKTNENVNMTCNVIPGLENSVTWYKDDNKINKKTPRMTLSKHWLKISKIKLSDQGHYMCSVENNKLYNVSLNVLSDLRPSFQALDHKKDVDDELWVETIDDIDDNWDDEEVKPYFTSYEKMHSIIAKTAGDNCTLICKAFGIPKPVTKWYKDDHELKNKVRSSLNFTQLSVKDSGTYTCIVSNSQGTIQHKSKLKVYESEVELPIFVETPANMTVLVGSAVSFECKPHSSESENIVWLKHNNYIDPSQFNDTGIINKYSLKNQPKNKQILSIMSVNLEDTGWYSCLIDGKASSSAWLQVNEELHPTGLMNDTHFMYSPVFTKVEKMPKVVAKPAGNMFRLKCAADGNPSPNITWYKNGKTPQRNLGSVKYSGWTMKMEDLIKSDSGNYTCIVCNILGCIEHDFKVFVEERLPHKPFIKEGYPRNSTVLVNTTAKLECPTLTDLVPYMQWVKVFFSYAGSSEINNVPDPLLNGTVIQAGDQNNSDPEKLIISNVTHEHEGWYTCIAGNSLGYTYASAYLEVVDEFPSTSDGSALRLFGALIVFCLFLIALVTFLLNAVRKFKREKLEKILALEAERAAAITQWTKKVIIEKQCLVNEQDPLVVPIVKIEKQKTRNTKLESLVSEYELPLDTDWEFPRTDLLMGKTLGEGAFGKVVKAEALGIIQPEISTIVAVKMLKEGHTDTEMMDLVSEMEMMKMIGKHRNIINILGCCTQDGPLYVIVEYAPYGNLRDFLRQHRPSSGYEPAIGEAIKDRNTLTQKDLVSFAYQAARGMDYLASKRCIHRDLAARNVLVSENYVLKIADFGLARDIHSHDYYRKTTEGRLPVKWMAPEALFHRIYTTQSDVWSYGVLLWEIMTLGGTPYPSVPNMEKLFQLLRSGHRMEKPPCCSLEIYMVMRDCWSYQANERPTFSDLVKILDRILMVTANEEYLDLGLPHLDTPPTSQESSNDEEFPYLLNVDSPSAAMSEKVIKIVPVNLQEFDLLINKETTVEETIIVFCKRFNIKPICRNLFAVRDRVDHWLPLHVRLWDMNEDVFKKGLEIRIRYRMPNIQSLKNMDLRALDYYFLQVREDILNSNIKEISYEKHKDELMGLGVTDMYRVMIEKNLAIPMILNDYKRHIPKEILKHHKFFVKKPIFDSLTKLESTGNRDVLSVKYNYLFQFEGMAPNYLSEEFEGQIEDKGVFRSADLFVNIYSKERPGVSFCFKQGVEGVTHLCSIDDICCVSICETTVEIARKNGIPVYIKMSKQTMDSFVTLLDGYYRLSVKSIFNICKDFYTPSLKKLLSLKIHGPVGGVFAYNKLEKKRENKPGCFILRECENTYNTYLVDVCTNTSKVITYKIEQKGEGHFLFEGDKNTYDSIQAILAKFRSPEIDIPMIEIIPPSEYDESQVLLCRKLQAVKERPKDIADDTNASPQCISFKNLQIFPGNVYPSKRGFTQVEKFLWKTDSPERKVTVAVKVLKKANYDKHLQEFLQMMNKWTFLKSNTIVRLLGITIFPVAMVTEYYPLGCLDDYLQKYKDDIREVDLVEAAAFIAKALWHLEGEGIVHGYLRCHKVLVVSHTSLSFNVRLSDPGIQALGDQDWHWIPPELYDDRDEIYKRTAADVWALGTTLWQVFSYGEQPFVNGSIKDFYLSRKRLDMPKDCSEEIFRIIEECWHHDPDQRKRPQGALRDLHQLLYQVHNSRRPHTYTLARPVRSNEDDESCTSVTSQLTTSSYMDDPDTADKRILFGKDSSLWSHFNLQNSSLDSTTSIQSIYELSRNLDSEGIKNIVLETRIGKGCYGEVYRAIAEYTNHASEPQIVAVKKLNTNHSSSGRADFQREIAIMKSLKHPNIVEVKGVIQEPEILLIMEYVPQGSLKCHLCSNRDHFTERHLFKYSLDIARGMDYLAQKNIVHRDLAARNILVASEFTVKISDFGLAQVTDNNYYILKTCRELPLLWYAPESIQDGKFSTYSDVWSYGVLLYEMFSFGQDPVINNQSSNAETLYTCLKSGTRLPRPESCPGEVYASVMMRCWKFNDKERPSFMTIIEIVNKLAGLHAN
ncbi:uncharacterized protein LOC106664605 [Cimex lectularius]|uniref:Receptor protein-tyrosine kinase n=1 Tax=Cimex lectularius TaxID=79782 RepID=A0A8I6TFA1_CIMLE|nr:uncharacterized protein LOC106664605 [Cimex lectularius]